jgi:hypothetical protein
MPHASDSHVHNKNKKQPFVTPGPGAYKVGRSKVEKAQSSMAGHYFYVFLLFFLFLGT